MAWHMKTIYTLKASPSVSEQIQRYLFKEGFFWCTGQQDICTAYPILCFLIPLGKNCLMHSSNAQFLIDDNSVHWYKVKVIKTPLQFIKSLIDWKKENIHLFTEE